jgi:nitric oxide reductase activation protein
MRENYEKAAAGVKQEMLWLKRQLARLNGAVAAYRYGFREGELDEDSLACVKTTGHIFMQRLINKKPMREIDCCLLIDESASMHEPLAGEKIAKYEAARRMAALFVFALKHNPAFRPAVYSYTTGDDKDRTVELKALYEPQDGNELARIGDLYPARRSPEYEALRSLYERLNQPGARNRKKLFIVISDGFPEDDWLPYEAQAENLKKWVSRLESEGVIAISIELEKQSDRKPIYRHRIPFPAGGFPQLVRQFSRLLLRLLEQQM